MSHNVLLSHTVYEKVNNDFQCMSSREWYVIESVIGSLWMIRLQMGFDILLPTHGRQAEKLGTDRTESGPLSGSGGWDVWEAIL